MNEPANRPGGRVRTVHVVLPNDIDDPTSPSGGNVYDRRICNGLAALGWSVREHAVRGSWPSPAAPGRGGVARALAGVPDDSVVLLDGLVASAVPDVLTPHARRLRLAVLMHMPLGDERERETLSAAVAVVATSQWSRRRLIDRHGLPADRIHVAPPGVDTAPLAPGSAAGSALLCVGEVGPHKGHDVLVEALAAVQDAPWSCVCVGPLRRDPGFVDRLRRRARWHGIADRIAFVGPRTGPDLDARYAAADLLVLASRAETYGMVITEALARGIPVLATAADGLPEALGHAPDTSLPGMLVPPDDPAALTGALRRWLDDPDLRHQLRRSARGRRTTLAGWATTSKVISAALSGILADVSARG